jgi:uncharacterized protein
MNPPASLPRIAALDLMRGIAVLGILAVNVAGFAGPLIATETPALPHGASTADEWIFAGTFVLFEGKMRALFSILFGASMLLFVESAEARGRNGTWLQLRRLTWLMLFGWLHYVLLWWGDILFDYAVAGALALMLRRAKLHQIMTAALMIFATWHLWSMAVTLPGIVAEEQVRLGSADPAATAFARDNAARTAERMRHDLAQGHMGFVELATDKLRTAPGWPAAVTLYTLGETVPLMLLGMVLLRTGFFAGQWPRATLWRVAIGGIGLGGAMTLALLGWAWPRHFPPQAMGAIISYWAGPAHVLMAMGYAAVIMLLAPQILATALGQRLAAAGRMAFTNYLGTTIAMTALFYGWGLGLFDRVPTRWQPLLVIDWWTVMLAWSKPWLAHFRQGPLEWLWRSLTEWRIMPWRR